jgi:tRNA nucleotidyltransferase/poly(A) polymerase
VDHGTVGVLAPDGTLYEVTTFRQDVETFGRRAVVKFAEHIEDDLSRRDFTLNALAWHPERERVLDPWNGATDLEQRILRTVGEPVDRFAEDLLRVLRALRFAGQFELTIQSDTWQALCSAVPELSELSPERIQEEMMKVLSQAETPSVALGLYAESGVFAELYPELDAGSAIGTTLRACDAVPRSRPLVRLSLLFALATIDAPSDEARQAIESLMERLRFSNADTKRVATVAAYLSPVPASEEPAVLRRWLSRVGPEHFADIARAWLAHARAAADGTQDNGSQVDVLRRVRALRAILREGPSLTIADLALDGSGLMEMGLSPGPQFGEILRYLLEEVLDRPEANNRADLEALARQRGSLADTLDPEPAPRDPDS